MKNNSTASASGKLILMGEHAVLYGAPCLVTAINKYLTVTIEKIQGSQIIVDAPQTTDTRFLDASIALTEKKWGRSVNGFPADLSTNTSCQNTVDNFNERN